MPAKRDRKYDTNVSSTLHCREASRCCPNMSFKCLRLSTHHGAYHHWLWRNHHDILRRERAIAMGESSPEIRLDPRRTSRMSRTTGLYVHPAISISSLVQRS